MLNVGIYCLEVITKRLSNANGKNEKLSKTVEKWKNGIKNGRQVAGLLIYQECNILSKGIDDAKSIVWP